MEEFDDCVFHYDEEKERWLQTERGLSFDVIAEYMREGNVVDIQDNPSPRYPHKKIAFVELEGYITVVPYIREGNDVFLKTAFRNRKANKTYGRKKYGSQEKNPRLH